MRKAENLKTCQTTGGPRVPLGSRWRAGHARRRRATLLAFRDRRSPRRQSAEGPLESLNEKVMCQRSYECRHTQNTALRAEVNSFVECVEVRQTSSSRCVSMSPL